MKLICDVHISIKIAKLIERLGYTCEHVNDMPAKWETSDAEITRYADAQDLILITKDQDFKNSFLLNYKPKKLIKVNLGNISNEELSQIIGTNLSKIAQINDEHNSFMIEITKENVWILTKK